MACSASHYRRPPSLDACPYPKYTFLSIQMMTDPTDPRPSRHAEIPVSVRPSLV